jgi:hypothetical protein
MQLVLDIDDSQRDVVLNIIKNLKDGIVKNYRLLSNNSINDIEYVSAKEEEEIKSILSTLTDEDKEVVDVREYNITL